MRKQLKKSIQKCVDEIFQLGLKSVPLLKQKLLELGVSEDIAQEADYWLQDEFPGLGLRFTELIGETIHMILGDEFKIHGNVDMEGKVDALMKGAQAMFPEGSVFLAVATEYDGAIYRAYKSEGDFPQAMELCKFLIDQMWDELAKENLYGNIEAIEKSGDE